MKTLNKNTYDFKAKNLFTFKKASSSDSSAYGYDTTTISVTTTTKISVMLK
ncbi:hypothetical protein INP83_12405 [Mucilaginibacter sp. 21P]|uniref:hypothetical protein n=1 Tax=Mucilaginibacter sp. 21P TaxID=2778902 RepID=UPI001C57123E|nr:hypothetical protein [Mucilaginibacter sp. 21P]QXV63905.1 hypothetical protein INP83_12405 [Mucilaginibacter sp. 21P]